MTTEMDRRQLAPGRVVFTCDDAAVMLLDDGVNVDGRVAGTVDLIHSDGQVWLRLYLDGRQPGPCHSVPGALDRTARATFTPHKTEPAMTTNRDAAILLYMAARQRDQMGLWAAFHPAEGDRARAALAEDAARAAAALEAFDHARALGVAIGALLPGWRDIDASEYLPRDLWGTFISNDRDEWIAWLTAHGVPEEAATALVNDAFGEQP